MRPTLRHNAWKHARWRIDTLSEPGTRDEDCFDVRISDGVIRIALADGAGGMTGGKEASARAVREAMNARPSLALAASIDHALRDRGQTTLVALELDVHAGRVHGVSVGDSRAWTQCQGTWVEVTERQSRKPLLGDGNARATMFAAHDVAAICVASDGLASRRDMRWIVSAIESASGETAHLAHALIDPLRRPNGRLEDDVSIVLLRPLEQG